jgi:alpha-glucosidase (family GH31 glycosyl hydrolase)
MLAALVRNGHLIRLITWALIPHNFHSTVGNTNEELCNRWMQLAAFTPFFRNHNIRGAIPQEPYRWDSVAHATRTATSVRYALLPYWARLSLFARLLTISVR